MIKEQPATIIRVDWEVTDDEAILVSLIELISDMHHAENEQVASSAS